MNRVLPDGWHWVRFGDVVRQVKDTTKEPESEGLTRVVGLEHLDSESLPLRRWNDLEELPDGTSFTRIFRAGQVLFGKRRSYQRKVAVADFNGVCSGDILVFEPATDELLPGFLPYIVQSDGFFDHALGTSAGSLSPRTKWQELAKHEFPLPTRTEQRDAVESLAASQDLLYRYQRVSRTSELFRDAAFVDAWAASGTTAELQDLADITVGIVVKPAALYVESGGVRALRSLNVLQNRLVEGELVQISEDAHRERQKSQLRGDDVVVIRSGRPGDAAVVPTDGLERHAIDLLIVRCGPQLRPQFLTAYLNSQEGRTQMLGRSAGTAQKHLNAGQLKQVRVPLADADTQSRVTQIAEESASFATKLDSAIDDLMSAQRAMREHFLGGVDMSNV